MISLTEPNIYICWSDDSIGIISLRRLQFCLLFIHIYMRKTKQIVEKLQTVSI